MIVSRLVEAWRRYWFGLDGRVSIEIARIALAVGALLMWLEVAEPDYAAFLARFRDASYRGWGILSLLGTSAPSASLLEACKIVALVSIVAMGIGLATRLSILVSLLSMLIVGGIHDSFGPTWSHSLTPFLLAHCAFAFAPAGRALSVDAAIRRIRGRAAKASPAGWAVLLVQMAVAIPFFNAALWKIAAGRGLGWVLSDSLRHHILAQFDWAGHERTALADLIVHHAALWKSVALLNILNQVAPFVACFFTRRPLVRLCLGLAFVAETIALDVVMGLANYHWLPLAVVFVDWDRLAVRLGQRPAMPEPPSPQRRRLASIYIAAFLTANLVAGFSYPGLDNRLKTYPFSQYRMFCVPRAKRPYGEHQTFEFDALRFEVDSDRPTVPAVEAALARRFRKYSGVRAPNRIEDIAREAAVIAGKREPASVTVRFFILQAPAYPAEPELIPHIVGILGRLREGAFESLLGEAGTDSLGAYVEPRATGMADPGEIELGYILDQDPREHPLAAVRRGGRYYYQPGADGRYTFIAHVGGERFVIAERVHGDQGWRSLQ